MIIDVHELDLIKGVNWREELHPRGADGKFAAIRSGSKVVAKNGTAGKVTKVTSTHYHVEKDDGKVAKVLKGNVMHEKDHAELTKKKAAPKKKATTKKGEATNGKTGTKRAQKTGAGAQPAPASGRKPAGKPAGKPTAAKPQGAATKGVGEPLHVVSYDQETRGTHQLVQGAERIDANTLVHFDGTHYGVYDEKSGVRVAVNKDKKRALASYRRRMKEYEKPENAHLKAKHEKLVAQKAKQNPANKTAKKATGRKTANAPATKKTTKRTASKPSGASKGSGKAVPAAKKAAPKKSTTKDIRTETQKNRKLAYDAGDKVGGARKDLYEANFKENPTLKTLKELERDNPAVAQKLTVKKHLLPPVDFEAERKAGVDIETAMMKKAIFDRVAPKPADNSPEGRKAYVQNINKLHRHFAGIKSFDTMKAAFREFSELGYNGKNYAQAKRVLDNADSMERRGSYVNRDYYQKILDKGENAKATMDFTPLGEKLENLFTSYESRESTVRTVFKNSRGGWDHYFGNKEKAKNAPKKSTENAKWERKAASEHLRKGGRKTKVEKPEDLIKQFGMRGVEFGHWVNDSSGKYHLQRSAEAFSDLSDVLGIDDKDVSLNKRLAIAFGARGKGGALAHYEPSRKVINMTKHGGAGSLAHEWGHALDNIMHQYSSGAKSMEMASDGMPVGIDPKLNILYDELMDAIKEPAPNTVRKVKVDSEDPNNRQAHYYPRIRTILTRNPTAAGMKEATEAAHAMIENNVVAIARAKSTLGYEQAMAKVDGNMRRVTQVEKRIKGYERDLREMEKAMPHILANDYKQATGKPYQGTIDMPATSTEFHDRMKSMDGNRKKYYQQPAEMFARVFEAYVEDKLAKDKRSNNYLVHGTDEDEVKTMGAPFPVGAERKRMFKAMESLLTHISKGGALKKALELERLGKSFNETAHPRDAAGRFTRLAEVAGASRDHMVMYMDASSDPEAMQELKTAVKEREGTLTHKLKEIFDELWAGKTREFPDYAAPNRKPLHAMDMSAPAHSPESLTVTLDPTKMNHASAPEGVGITIGETLLREPPRTQAHILTHEVGHVISNLHDGLARHILDNPQNALGRLNLKENRFEGVFGTHTPEESFAEAYAVYHTHPDELRGQYPLAHQFVESVTQLLPHHIDYLKQAKKALQELN